MKLKTLKDLYFAEMEKMGMEPVVQAGRLKKEAVKWVNKEGMIITADEWIEFFNITEEDLKESEGGKE